MVWCMQILKAFATASVWGSQNGLKFKLLMNLSSAVFRKLFIKVLFLAPLQVREFLQTKIGRLPHEVFLCLYLDSSNRLIECQELFRGSIDRTAIYPRVIIKESLGRNASALIVAHNHPGGNPLPSPQDELITKDLQEALSWVDINLLDHCIVAGHGFFSFSDAGLLNKPNNDSEC